MKRISSGLAATFAIVVAPYMANAADHTDAPNLTADPASDITDLFAWTSEDTEKLNLILNVFPFAAEGAGFSDATQYVFHVNSGTEYGGDQTETQILCQFYSADAIECWVGDEYVAGDASDVTGIVSDSGALRIFAGMRNDPFFMEFAGFTATVETVVSVAGDLTFDEAGCPALDADTSSALVEQLQSGPDGSPASDTLAGQNVMSLVLQIDKNLVAIDGPLLGVWASTHAAK